MNKLTNLQLFNLILYKIMRIIRAINTCYIECTNLMACVFWNL